jgi:hypothetical protein
MAPSGGRVEDQQSALAARERALRDPIRGQVEVEVANQHALRA